MSDMMRYALGVDVDVDVDTLDEIFKNLATLVATVVIIYVIAPT